MRAKPRAPKENDFDELDMQKQVKQKEQQSSRGKDNKLQVGSNL